MNVLQFDLFPRVRKSLTFISGEESTDCGYACIAMVANYHGHDIDLKKLRDIFTVSSRGTFINDLIHLADKVSLSSRILELDLESLEGLSTPCILHWNLDHYVVLKSVKKGLITIYDPAIGIKQMSEEEVSKCFTGYALEFTPKQDFTPLKGKTRISIQDLWTSSSGIALYFVKIALLLLLFQALAIVIPLYSKFIIDNVIVNADFGLLNILLISFIILGAISLITSVLQSLFTIHFSNTLSASIATNLKEHLLKLPLDYFQKRHIGDVNSRFASVENIISFISNDFLPTIISGFITVTMLSVMFYYSPLMTLVSILFIIIYIFMRLALFGKMKRATMDQLRTEAKASSIFMETLRGMQTIKLFGIENLRKISWSNQFIDSLNLNIRISHLRIVESDVKVFLFLVENLVILYLGAQLVIADAFTLGTLVAFLAFKDRLKESAVQFIDLMYRFKLLNVHLARLADIITTGKEDSDTGTIEKIEENAILSLRDVSFRYPGENSLLFENVNLTIKPGSIVAVLGGSGSGKTTLLKVILGLLEPESGSVVYGNRDIRDLGLNRYRKKFSTIMQDDELFSGTLFENITLFAQSVDYEKLDLCTKQAAIYDEIQAMPLKYDTIIGDMGSSLSGGQKQRILIARALYAEPQIIVMDEATSNLDVNNEERINRVFRSLHITRVIVAHRHSTIAVADEFFRLEGGRLSPLERSEALG